MKHLNEEQIRRVIFEVPKTFRDHLMLLILYETGIRVGEIANLKVGDIDLDESYLMVRNAKHHPEGRKVVLWNKITIEKLRGWIGERSSEEFVFISQKAVDSISKRQIQRIYEDCAKRSGLDRELQHVHVLRHTHAAMATKYGVDIGSIQQNLGHKNPEGTGYYLESYNPNVKEVYKKHMSKEAD